MSRRTSAASSRSVATFDRLKIHSNRTIWTADTPMLKSVTSKVWSAVCLAFAIFFLGQISATAGRMGYYHALLRTWSIPIPAATWPWIASTGTVSLILLCGLVLVLFWMKPNVRLSIVRAFVLLTAGVWGTILGSYVVGRTAAYVVGNSQSVDIVDIKLGKPEQVAIFYRSDVNDAVGVVLDSVTHKMTHEYFSTPIIKGRLNCDPISSRRARYSEIK